MGVADSVAKSGGLPFAGAALGMHEQVHMTCHEGKFPNLLAQLSIHRLDLLLADEPASKKIGVRAFQPRLGLIEHELFCAPSQKELQGAFPGGAFTGRPCSFKGHGRRCASNSTTGSTNTTCSLASWEVRRQRSDERLRAGRRGIFTYPPSGQRPKPRFGVGSHW